MVDQRWRRPGRSSCSKGASSVNRTLEMLSAVDALIVRAGDRQALLGRGRRIAVEKGGFVSRPSVGPTDLARPCAR